MTKRQAPGQAANSAWTLDEMPWDPVQSDGTTYALLEGDRDIAGALFSYAFFLPAGFWDPPHWHSQAARVVVVKGVLRLGYGNRFDPPRALAYPVGSVVHVPAHARHFDGATEDTVIVGVAQGVWRTTYVDPQHSGSAGTPAG